MFSLRIFTSWQLGSVIFEWCHGLVTLKLNIPYADPAEVGLAGTFTLMNDNERFQQNENTTKVFHLKRGEVII